MDSSSSYSSETGLANHVQRRGWEVVVNPSMNLEERSDWERVLVKRFIDKYSMNT